MTFGVLSQWVHARGRERAGVAVHTSLAPNRVGQNLHCSAASEPRASTRPLAHAHAGPAAAAFRATSPTSPTSPNYRVARGNSPAGGHVAHHLASTPSVVLAVAHKLARDACSGCAQPHHFPRGGGRRLSPARRTRAWTPPASSALWAGCEAEGWPRGGHAAFRRRLRPRT